MNTLDEDLDDSALICSSIKPKRKAFTNVSPKNSKQLKLATSQKNYEKDTKWGESSYFSAGSKFNTCPLCLKQFKSDSAYSSHMKLCAKSHKMTTQQLLEALELQKKQMHERRALGLCSQSLPITKKQTSKKKTDKTESYDLALGLALSKSLASEVKGGGSQEATLEEFGFTLKTAGISRKNGKKSILKERTTEERQRIIVEKVAVVLLDDEERKIIESRKPNENSLKVPQLWNLGENNEKQNWYVTEIKQLVLSSEETTSDKSTPVLDISNKILDLNLPQKDFNECWKKMINNSTKSDLVVQTKDNQDVYVHSLVLFTRCSEALDIDFESIVHKYNQSTILILLEYLYCGTLNGLIATEIENLYELAIKINYKELVLVLDCLKSKLGEPNTCGTTPDLDITEKENKVAEDEDLFFENNLKNLTQGGSDESNIEKSYWSFIQHEKKRQNLDAETNKLIEGKKTAESINFATEDLVEDAQTNSDCIILSSGSEQQCNPSTPLADYEVPPYDPYDNFNMFSEDPFSPVGLNSQSLLTGDISIESLKLSTPTHDVKNDEVKTMGYCSTPVTVRQSCKIKSSTKKKYKKRNDLSASRILRKSLGLNHRKTPKLCKKSRSKKKENDVVEVLATTVLHELSKSSLFQRKNFVEITPLHNREDFKESVTPSPNYSIMGESLIKEQLTKYGLKKSLAKSKAKKILRHIYDELHPLYNTETGKIVKILPSDVPDKEKPKKSKSAKKKKNCDLNSSKESENISDVTIGPNECRSDGSDFDDLNETLTQSLPSNPIDLPSAFSDYLQNNPEYHQKILLYEPIWLEELQRDLKETYKKHFKMSDIMDYLDQKCITFRSASQAKRLQKKHQKKENYKKKSLS